MTFDQIFLLGLLCAVFVLFLWGRWRYDVVAFAALLAATLAGTVPAAEAFVGFGHPATFTVAAVLIISRALQNSGAVDLIARHLLPPVESASQHVGILSGVAAALSAVMNNVGALALLMPAALQSAAKIKRPAAVILMPLSFGSILGGLVTLIGTPPNIIIAAFRAEAVGEPFGMFDFTPVGGVVALTGLVFVAFVGWRLIPKTRRAKILPHELFQIESYVTEAVVPEGSKAIGEALTDLDDKAGGHDAVLLGLIRDERRIDRVGRRERIREGDVIIVEAAPEALDAALNALDLHLLGSSMEDSRQRASGDMSVSEAVVQPNSRIVGRTASALRLRGRYSVNLLAVSREGQPFRGRLRNFRFHSGDILLLEGDVDRLPEVVSNLGCLPLAERGLQVGQPRKAGLSITIFAAAVLCATFGLVSLPVALAAAAACLIVLNIVPPREIYDSVDWPVVVLLAAMIPVGTALVSSGATLLIATSLVDLVSGAAPAVMLTLVLVITMTLSDVINNAATAVVMGPIGVTIAKQLGANPDPFLMAVAVGASCAFLTPIGHQNNTLVMGPAGYRFGDYWRMGLPLELIIVVVAVPMILWVWPL